jgi:LysM repeat protein
MNHKRVFQLSVLAAILVSSLLSGVSASASAACGTSYVVQSGDTLGMIARNCGTSVAALKLANPNMGAYIYAGQTLLLPGAFTDHGNGYATYIVARGDTLKSLATRFGTSMSYLASANGISNFNLIYEGQRLSVPSGNAVPGPIPSPVPPAAGMYIVQWGDTLRKIAARLNVSVNDLIAVNPQIGNPNIIFPGQVINIPAAATHYTVQRGDTMRLISARYGTTVDHLMALNPQIRNANWIYAGQVIRIQ